MSNSLRVKVNQSRHCLQHVVPHGAFTVALLFAHKAKQLSTSHSATQIKFLLADEEWRNGRIKCTSNLYCILCIIYSYIRCIEIHDMHVLLIRFKRRVRKKNIRFFQQAGLLSGFSGRTRKKTGVLLKTPTGFFKKTCLPFSLSERWW